MENLNLSIVSVVVIVALLIFLLCREVICWYWKINKISESLDNILMELKRINEKPKV